MPPGENVLAAALAAGISLPHSCRAGRCATCKAKLLSGDIAYPAGALPPGIAAAEAARGEVLLCQARPRTDLVVETRQLVARAAAHYTGDILTIGPLPFGGLHLRVRIAAGSIGVRPGQWVDVRNDTGDAARLAVVAVDANELGLEAADGGTLREWLGGAAALRATVSISGPFDRPR